MYLKYFNLSSLSLSEYLLISSINNSKKIIIYKCYNLILCDTCCKISAPWLWRFKQICYLYVQKELGNRQYNKNGVQILLVVLEALHRFILWPVVANAQWPWSGDHEVHRFFFLLQRLWTSPIHLRGRNGM